MSSRRKLLWIVLLILAAGIKVLSFFPVAVERVYSHGIYPCISTLQRLVFGWIPFSVGDILYLAAGIGLLYALIRLILRLVRREASWKWAGSGLRKVVGAVLVVYVVFNGFWGLNYDRLDIADQLQLNVKPYSTEELARLLQKMSDRLAALDSRDSIQRPEFFHSSPLFDTAIAAYRSLEDQAPKLKYPFASVKPSLYSYPGDYIGFLGYYNPFTGEAQVNTTVPVFTRPFTVCHEMGHQLGYAKENEANLIGYLTIAHTKDINPAFLYSASFEMYMYAARELYARDSTLYIPFRLKQKPGLKRDIRENQEFSRRYANPFEPMIWKAYAHYLKANKQPKGIRTYNEVLAWLIAYANKNGWDAI